MAGNDKTTAAVRRAAVSCRTKSVNADVSKQTDDDASGRGQLRPPMPVLSLQSRGAIPLELLNGASRFQVETDPPELKMDTRSLLCPCPECDAPMTVRYWLMTADCFVCGTSIELSLVGKSTAERAKKKRQPAAIPAAPIAPPSIPASTPTPTPMPPATARQRMPEPDGPPANLEPAAEPAAVATAMASAVSIPRSFESLRFPREIETAEPSLRRMLRERSFVERLWDLPAWLTSLGFHLLVLLLLALLNAAPQDPARAITLSMTISPTNREGGRVELPMSVEPEFDLPIPDHEEWRDPERQEQLRQADLDARKLRTVSEDLAARQLVHRPGPTKLASRDPRVRVEVVRREGGTTLTEAAVARGLAWLAKHQTHDGSWSLHRFANHANCRGRCSGEAHLRSDAAATSLALLPFLGAGQTPDQGIYQTQVEAGLLWLVENQRSNGDLSGRRSDDQCRMYAHGQAAIVLCEAYAMTDDPRWREPAQLAIEFIEDAQHRRGGWRYDPGQRGDTSVLGWQVMALQSARNAGLTVAPDAFAGAAYYLDRAQDRHRYGYQPGHRGTPTMTAEAILCRMYLGATLDDEKLNRGLDWLVESHAPNARKPNIYYWYYATQALHQAGGPLWEQWNSQLREILVDQQETSGHEAGSWRPRGAHADAGGRLYMTALSICTLEVYYRQTPIFRPLYFATK